jgi:hypothetical protein
MNVSPTLDDGRPSAWRTLLFRRAPPLRKKKRKELRMGVQHSVAGA